MQPEFDHVALLVSNLEKSIDAFNPEWHIDTIDTFPSEGTKEVYIGPPNATGRLLLIEPIGDGPYKTAYAKRGAGLHHIAINVDNIHTFSEKISGSGWYLHPASLNSFQKHKTIWLARPATPLLVEVVQRKPMAHSGSTEFVSKIDLPLPKDRPSLIKALGIDQLHLSQERFGFVTIQGVRYKLKDFV